ncbi:Nesprin-2 [Manis pentadactyla]|nr:Nesprin-2 [Manis pentadactyla]
MRSALSGHRTPSSKPSGLLRHRAVGEEPFRFSKKTRAEPVSPPASPLPPPPYGEREPPPHPGTSGGGRRSGARGGGGGGGLRPGVGPVLVPRVPPPRAEKNVVVTGPRMTPSHRCEAYSSAGEEEEEEEEEEKPASPLPEEAFGAAPPLPSSR